MRPRISIRGCVHPSIGRSVRPSVRWSVGRSVRPSVGLSVRNHFSFLGVYSVKEGKFQLLPLPSYHTASAHPHATDAAVYTALSKAKPHLVVHFGLKNHPKLYVVVKSVFFSPNLRETDNRYHIKVISLDLSEFSL